MNYCIVLLFLILGLVFGSFLSVLVSRIEIGESFLFSRSRCPKCKKQIKNYDLIPFLSYFILRGKCRNCKEKISFSYPLIEAITSLVFVLFYWRFNYLFSDFNGYLFFGIYLSSILSLIVILFYDAIHYIIPDKITYPSIFVLLILSLINIFSGLNFFIYNPELSNLLYGALLGGGFFLFMVLISKEKWMGWGDVKLGFLLGILLGFPLILLSLFISFFSGSIYGIILIVINKKKMMDKIPFGPFLVFGAIISLFFGKYILDFYLNI